MTGSYKRSEASFYGENRPPRPGSIQGLRLKYRSTVILTLRFLLRRISDGGGEIRRRRGLFSLPSDTVPGVLEDHADRRQCVANSVGGREVFPLAGVLTEGNDQVEQGVHEVRAFRSRLEDAQHLSERAIRPCGEVDRSAVLDVDQEEADYLGLVELQGRLYGPVVAEGLVHLLPFHGDHAAVHPVLHEGRDARVRLGLGDLRLMVREYQFRRAAVEVVLRSEVSDRDRGVLDVPSGPALAPRAVPRGLARFLGPP